MDASMTVCVTENTRGHVTGVTHMHDTCARTCKPLYAKPLSINLLVSSRFSFQCTLSVSQVNTEEVIHRESPMRAALALVTTAKDPVNTAI